MRDSAAAVTAHMEWMRQRGLAPSYITARRRILTHLHGHLPRPLLHATARDLSRWRSQLTTAPATGVHAVSHVREFYAWAVRARLIPVSPAAEIPVPRIGRGIPRPVSEARMAAALDGAPARIRPWLILGGCCGLRAQEIARLRVEDIWLWATPPMLIVSSFAGKGGRQRAVPLGGFVLAEIPTWGLPAHGWAFPRCDGKAGPNAPWVGSQLGGEQLPRCGIGASMHQLRHRCLTKAYQAHRDLRATQTLAGHASPTTTAVYTMVSEEAVLDAVNGIPAPGTWPGLEHGRGGPQ